MLIGHGCQLRAPYFAALGFARRGSVESSIRAKLRSSCNAACIQVLAISRKTWRCRSDLVSSAQRKHSCANSRNSLGDAAMARSAQAGARPVSRSPAPGTGPLPMMKKPTPNSEPSLSKSAQRPPTEGPILLLLLDGRLLRELLPYRATNPARPALPLVEEPNSEPQREGRVSRVGRIEKQTPWQYDAMPTMRNHDGRSGQHRAGCRRTRTDRV
jgi:hypothetical protein